MAQKYLPLKVRPELAGNLLAIQSKEVQGEDARQLLGNLLQSALQLEFSTVPPYLSAAFSFRKDNENISELIIRVAKEEMLHMTAVANLMNAIGVAPDIIGAIPEYPYDLDVLDPPLQLDLKSFSYDLVENLFMRIETPEDPVDFPVEEAALPEDMQLPETIGQFYERIIELIKNDTIPDLFENAGRDAYKQIKVEPNFRPVHYLDNEDEHTYPLGQGIDFVIKDRETAVNHLTWVVAEGEGASPFDPLDAEGIPGHYYRFESILKQKYLVKDENFPEGFSYSGGGLPFSPEGVHEFDDNAKVESYSDHRSVERQMKRFNKRYTEMIDFMQVAFNCPSADQAPQAKQAYDDAIGIMRNMPSAASNIVGAAERAGIKAGIPFQYLPSGPDSVSIA